MGFNRTWPIALRYGAHQFGGLGIRKLETEAMIKKIQGLQSLIEKPDSSKLIMIALWLRARVGKGFSKQETTTGNEARG